MAPKRPSSGSPTEKAPRNHKRLRCTAPKSTHRGRAAFKKAAKKESGSRMGARKIHTDTRSAPHASNGAPSSSSSRRPIKSTDSSRTTGIPESPSVSEEDPNNQPRSTSVLNLQTPSTTQPPAYLTIAPTASIIDQPPSPVSSSASVASFRSRRSSLASMFGRFTLSEDGSVGGDEERGEWEGEEWEEWEGEEWEGEEGEEGEEEEDGNRIEDEGNNMSVEEAEDEEGGSGACDVEHRARR